jgi:hypothetical protein
MDHIIHDQVHGLDLGFNINTNMLCIFFLDQIDA